MVLEDHIVNTIMIFQVRTIPQELLLYRNPIGDTENLTSINLLCLTNDQKINCMVVPSAWTLIIGGHDQMHLIGFRLLDQADLLLLT